MEHGPSLEDVITPPTAPLGLQVAASAAALGPFTGTSAAAAMPVVEAPLGVMPVVEAMPAINPDPRTFLLAWLHSQPGAIVHPALDLFGVRADGERGVFAMGPIAAGDTARWIIGDTESGSGVNRRVHILVKPSRQDISTNLVVTTDRRTYMIELRAREALYMPSVAWAYPARPASQRQTVPAAPIIPAEAARNYRYGLTGDSPPWRPISVFDDGRRIYVVFPRGIVQGEMPPIFVLGSDGEPQIVNSRIHQNILIVDRLFGAAELRLGSGNRQQTVRIVRIEQGQAAQPANTGESPS